MIARSNVASDYATKAAVKNSVNMLGAEALLDNFSGMGSKLTSVQPLSSITLKNKLMGRPLKEETYALINETP